MAENRYYLTTNKHPREPGKLIAVISKGSPQLGDKNVVVCDVEVVSSRAEAKMWMKKQMQLRPWEKDKPDFEAMKKEISNDA